MKHFGILLLLLVFPCMAADQQPAPGRLVLSLKRAVELSLAPEGNAQIQLSGESLQQAHARSDQARAALLPDVSSSLTYRNQTVNLGANGLGFNIPTVPGFSFEFPCAGWPLQRHGRPHQRVTEHF